MSVAAVTRSFGRPLAAIGGNSIVPISEIPVLPFNYFYVVDQFDNHVGVDGVAQISPQSNTVYVAHTSVVASGITSIGYYSVFNGIKSAKKPHPFTDLLHDLASYTAAFSRGGIFWEDGLLRVDLPRHAYAGFPDQIIMVINNVVLSPVEVAWRQQI